MSCINYEDVLSHYPCAIQGICVSQIKIETEIAIATEIVSKYLCKELCLTEECRYMCGTGHNTLYLDSKLNRLDSITYNGELVTELPTHVGNSLIYQNCNKKFPCGDRNIQVCGSWGEEIPLGIQKVIIGLALESAQPGITGLQSVTDNVSAISWGDVSITYSAFEADTGFTTGFIELDNILSLYLDVSDLVGITVVGSCDPCDNEDNCNCSEGTK